MFDFKNIFNLLEGALTIFSGVQQYQAQQTATNQALLQQQALIKQQQAQAEADAYNQRVALENAKLVEEQTAAELSQADRERRLRAGANVAAAGASGVGIQSAMDVLQDNARQEELNLLTIESEGLLKQQQYEQQAELTGMSRAGALEQAGIMSAQLPYIQESGSRSQAASLLGSISKGLSLWG